MTRVLLLGAVVIVIIFSLLPAIVDRVWWLVVLGSGMWAVIIGAVCYIEKNRGS